MEIVESNATKYKKDEGRFFARFSIFSEEFVIRRYFYEKNFNFLVLNLRSEIKWTFRSEVFCFGRIVVEVVSVLRTFSGRHSTNFAK